MLKQNIKKGEKMKDFLKKILRIKGISYIMLALTVGIILIVISGRQSDNPKQGNTVHQRMSRNFHSANMRILWKNVLRK